MGAGGDHDGVDDVGAEGGEDGQQGALGDGIRRVLVGEAAAGQGEGLWWVGRGWRWLRVRYYEGVDA